MTINDILEMLDLFYANKHLAEREYRERSRGMNVNDLILSIKCALYEEQINAHKQMKIFDRDEITIMATQEAIDKIFLLTEPLINFCIDGNTKCFGCNLKRIDGKADDLYIARKIPIISEKVVVEGADNE